MSITKSQAREIALGRNLEGDFNLEDNKLIDLKDVTLSFFEKYAAIYLLAISESIKKNQVVGSGKMLKGIDPQISKEESTMRIYMADYYDFVNKGVKGVKNYKNAPASPYKYKNYVMNAEGRASIKDYIQSGKAKISVATKKNTTNAVGLEKKKISLIDLKTNTLIYLIKKYGIKTTNFFDEATESVRKSMIEDISEVMAQTIVIQIGQPKKK
jgi:hypothetical protein